MNNVERMLYEQNEFNKFQKVVTDSFSFVDSLIDKRDLNKFYEKEENDNANND